MKHYTLEQIIEAEKANRVEGGSFGIIACKEEILFSMKYSKKTLYQILEEYMESANNDIFFNKRMVLACWELINER